MDKFKIKFITPNEDDFAEIGVDRSYIKKAPKQHSFKSVKIYGLTCAQANILKQTAISCGTDCLVHRETITGKIEKTDCILSGSIREFEKISQQLESQPLKLRILGLQLNELVNAKLAPLHLKNTTLDWSKTYIMGILNITPDSFSDGGLYNDVEKAFNRASEMVKDGVDIIDIGGESTRPYAEKTEPDEEILRIKPVIEAIHKAYPQIPLSIDTRNAKTATVALETGADIVNDVSAGEWDKDMFKVCALHNIPLILNHAQGTPECMQNNPQYIDCIDEIYEYLKNRTIAAKEAGITQVIIDPGIGFGKTTAQNLELINNIDQFLSLESPLLVGHSRKNFLKETLNISTTEDLDKATIICSAFLAQKNVNILRVHDVKGHRAINVFGKF